MPLSKWKQETLNYQRVLQNEDWRADEMRNENSRLQTQRCMDEKRVDCQIKWPTTTAKCKVKHKYIDGVVHMACMYLGGGWVRWTFSDEWRKWRRYRYSVANSTRDLDTFPVNNWKKNNQFIIKHAGHWCR